MLEYCKWDSKATCGSSQLIMPATLGSSQFNAYASFLSPFLSPILIDSKRICGRCSCRKPCSEFAHVQSTKNGMLRLLKRFVRACPWTQTTFMTAHRSKIMSSTTAEYDDSALVQGYALVQEMKFRRRTNTNKSSENNGKVPTRPLVLA